MGGKVNQKLVVNTAVTDELDSLTGNHPVPLFARCHAGPTPRRGTPGWIPAPVKLTEGRLVMWTEGCCELRREPRSRPSGGSVHPRRWYQGSGEVPAAAWDSPGSPGVAVHVCHSPRSLLHMGKPEPLATHPQHCPKSPTRVRTQSHVSSSRMCHPLRHRADGPFSA